MRSALRAVRALPSGVLGPVDRSHGRQRLCCGALSPQVIDDTKRPTQSATQVSDSVADPVVGHLPSLPHNGRYVTELVAVEARTSAAHPNVVRPSGKHWRHAAYAEGLMCSSGSRGARPCLRQSSRSDRQPADSTYRKSPAPTPGCVDPSAACATIRIRWPAATVTGSASK
jgi:hypothetical protein